MQLFARPEYLNRLLTFRDKQIVKVITGVRRCGKSALLSLFRQALIEDGVDENRIVFLNFEDFDNDHLREAKTLHEFLKKRLVKGKMTYILLDEIQQVEDFARVVDSLFICENVDLYITGSNADLLSTEIATLLTGRYIEIKMFPLSFKEFVQATAAGDSLASAYRRYLERSSFPFALQLEAESAIGAYLEGIFNTILFKDVAARCRIAGTAVLESVVRFLFDSIGSVLSTRRVANTLTSTRVAADVKTVNKYISALVASQLFYAAGRYDVKGMRQLARFEKYYAVDVALRQIVLGRAGTDVGHLLENVVYLELLRRGYAVSVGEYEDFEVDFVARNASALHYIQVAATVRNKETLERELRPLRLIKDNHPKILLTLDDDPPFNFNGIWRVNALKWLMGQTPYA